MLWQLALSALDQGLSSADHRLGAEAAQLAGTLMRAETSCDTKAASQALQSLLDNRAALQAPQVNQTHRGHACLLVVLSCDTATSAVAVSLPRNLQLLLWPSS